jgi:hypothetical protein
MYAFYMHQDGTMMKHKLSRAKPKTMAEFMAIANKYETSDSAARVTFSTVEQAGRQSKPSSSPNGQHSCDRHGKRKDECHDNKYGSKQVVSVQGIPGASGSS